MTNFRRTPGYCLYQNKQIEFTSQGQDSLFYCPHCGLIDDKTKTDAHIWNPSPLLLDKLKEAVS